MVSGEAVSAAAVLVCCGRMRTMHVSLSESIVRTSSAMYSPCSAATFSISSDPPAMIFSL